MDLGKPCETGLLGMHFRCQKFDLASELKRTCGNARKIGIWFDKTVGSVFAEERGQAPRKPFGLFTFWPGRTLGEQAE
jgi:hypothetical protein